jgi:hypothetical protein
MNTEFNAISQEAITFDVWLDALSSLFKIKLNWDYVGEVTDAYECFQEYYAEGMSPLDVYNEEVSNFEWEEHNG